MARPQKALAAPVLTDGERMSFMRRFLRRVFATLGIGLLIVVSIVLIRYRSFVYAAASTLSRRIGSIDFYGTAGVDMESIRVKLPLKVGDFSARLHFGDARKAAFERATGHKPVNLAAVCCDAKGREWVFVGLGGRDVPLNPQPAGRERLSKPLQDLYREFFLQLISAVSRGNNLEDHSSGYALASDPALRGIQIRMREAALKNEPELLTVSANSSDAGSRQAAVHLLGYAQHSKRQVEALGKAARDADDTVRNNATRALMVLLDAFPESGKEVDLDYFLDLMNSPVWTDRNKASALLAMISRSRDRTILTQIRAKAFDPLLEMARWKAPHRVAALQILGRIGGVEEASLDDKLQRGVYDEILSTVH
jgi:hypothetical protein